MNPARCCLIFLVSIFAASCQSDDESSGADRAAEGEPAEGEGQGEGEGEGTEGEGAPAEGEGNEGEGSPVEGEGVEGEGSPSEGEGAEGEGSEGEGSPVEGEGSEGEGVEGEGQAEGEGAPFDCFNVHPYTRGDTSAFSVPPESNAAEPVEDGCVTDPYFGGAVCKAVDSGRFSPDETAGVVRPVYSRWRHENSSGEYYFVVKGGETPPGSGRGQLVILRAADNSTVKIVAEVYSSEEAEFRWDYTGDKPTTLYYREDCQFREYDFTTGATALIHDFANDFPNCGRILNDVEGDSSADSRYWAWMVQGEYDDNTGEFPMRAVITYDRTSDSMLGILDEARYQAMGGQGALPRPNMVDVSPLGTKAVLLFPRTDDGGAFDGPHAFDFDFANPVKVCNDETHGGWAFAQDGREVYVCQVNNSNWPNAEADTLAYTDILTGQTAVILFHEDLPWDVGGFHFGRFSDARIRGWMYMTTYSETGVSTSWLRNQAVLIEVKPYTEHPLIWRVADLHNTYPGPGSYLREGYSPLSADGRVILWGADWPGGDGTVDTYRVALPARWWETLGQAPTVCQ